MFSESAPPEERETTASGERSRSGLSWLVVLVGTVALGLTLISFVATKRAAVAADRARFQSLTDQLSAGFNERLRSTARALKTGAVMVTESEDMDREMWVDFLAATGLTSDSGTVGLGYIERVERAKVDVFEDRIRSSGLPDYEAEKAGEHDPLYLVSFIEPFEDNAGALGIDIANGVTRRTAAEIAMRELRVSMSRRIRVIVGNQETPGFLLFYPAFEKGRPTDTAQQREAHLRGWVYAAVRVDALVAPIQERYLREIGFTVHEGAAIIDGRLLWESAAQAESEAFMGVEEVDVFGQTWTVRTFARPELERDPTHGMAWFVLAVGFLGAVAAVMITLRLTDSRLRALRAAKRASDDLAVQEARIRSVFEASPVGLRLQEYDDSNTILVNPAYSRLTGIAGEDANNLAAFHQAIHPDDLPKWEWMLERIESGEATQLKDEVRFVRPDGSRVWVEYLWRRFSNPISGVRQDVTAMVDISTLKAQADALLLSKEQAEQASLAKSQFLAMMSHEIRTPMNGVIGMASLLLETELTDEQKDCAETIARSGGDLVAIINDILDFSKVEAGQLDLENAPFNLIDCLESAVELNTMRAAEKGLELLLDSDPGLPGFVMGDSTRLRQVLINLLSNGVKFTDQGEVTLKATVIENGKGEAGHKRVRFDVTDTGIGIAAKDMDRLFESFTQADASITRRFGGTGLGLAITKRLVEMMGGQMQCSSELGRGTTFSFELHLAIGASELPPPEAQPCADSRMLIVAENESLGKILERHCRELGFSVDIARGPEELQHILAQPVRFGAVLLDHRWHGRPTPTLTRQLVDAGPTATAKLVLLTPANVAPRKGGDAHIATTLRKPVRPSALRSVMESVARPTDVDASTPIPAKVITASPFPASPVRALKVLVAEDNMVNQRIFTQMLGVLQQDFKLVSDGSQVLPALREEMPDVILMDVQMPVMDGLQAAREVRQTFKVKDAPWIIAVTANAMEGDRQQCLAAGMNDYISKPLKVEQVKAAIERARRSLAGETNPSVG